MKKEKDSLVMDYLFSVIMALVLLCSQNFIDIPILSYFGSITLLIFTFVLFVDLFPERYKNKKNGSLFFDFEYFIYNFNGCFCCRTSI